MHFFLDSFLDIREHHDEKIIGLAGKCKQKIKREKKKLLLREFVKNLGQRV